jgi:hypothetical protein
MNEEMQINTEREQANTDYIMIIACLAWLKSKA